MDWADWHRDYEDPGSRLSRRLAVVQGQLRAALDAAPAGPLSVVSICAGQGRDLIGVLADHPRRADVRARLVELDPRNVAAARAATGAVEVVEGDAGLIDHYREFAPADVVLACGVFGNITDGDVQRTISSCAQLCREGGTVIWTRHRREPDRVPAVCEWFEGRGFERVFVSEPGAGFGVGAHRRVLPPEPFVAGARMFTFVRGAALRAS
jgi:SAM-dependent methyltransferase